MQDYFGNINIVPYITLSKNGFQAISPLWVALMVKNMFFLLGSCCSCNNSQISKNFGTSLLILLKTVLSPLCYSFGLFEASFYLLFGICLGLQMLWTVELSRFHVALSLSKFGQGLKWDFSCRYFGGQLEIAPMIKIFRQSHVLLFQNLALRCFGRCCDFDRRLRADCMPPSRP